MEREGFERERLEIETIGCVVIRGDGFGVAIDHHRFVAVFLEREGCVAATIVELDSLPDAAGSTAENDDLRAIDGAGFVFLFVRGIEVGREGFEFRGASVDALEYGYNAKLVAAGANGSRFHVPQFSELFIAGS